MTAPHSFATILRTRMDRDGDAWTVMAYDLSDDPFEVAVCTIMNDAFVAHRVGESTEWAIAYNSIKKMRILEEGEF